MTTNDSGTPGPAGVTALVTNDDGIDPPDRTSSRRPPSTRA